MEVNIRKRDKQGYPKWDYEAEEPEMKDKVYGNVKVISGTIRIKVRKFISHNGRTYEEKLKYILMECLHCGLIKWIQICKIKNEKLTRRCRGCPLIDNYSPWVAARWNAVRNRCQNPNNVQWEDYGGRGIEFRFFSVREATIWSIKHLDILNNKHLDIDRINNDGHYEPGNLRMSSRKQNTSHTRKNPLIPKIHRFREKYPEINYADGTLRTLFYRGLSPEEIISRWKKNKNRNKSRRIKTQPKIDPFIASLCADF